MPLGQGLCLHPRNGPLEFLAQCEYLGGNQEMFGKNLTLRIQQGCPMSTVQEAIRNIIFGLICKTGTEDDGRYNISPSFIEDPP